MKMEFDEEMEESVGKKGKNKGLTTMADVKEQLSKDFADEIADSHKYLCMAKIAKKAGDKEDCHYLTEMAKDEYTHAYFIHNFMEEHDIEVPEEHEEDFEKLKEIMSEFFR